ncbi:MAG: hypothetical protein KJZ83_04050 [Burkholderiaceae bacterium]|nr:hypothetical protein [Burkholderiaceae bacterium]
MTKIGIHRRIEASPKSELIYRGFTRRTTVAEPRLSEIVAEYRRIGFEVEVIEHQVEPDSCGVCFEVEQGAARQYCDVYVRSSQDRGEGSSAK